MTTKDDGVRKTNFSCTFCGPGKRARWEVVTDDGVSFVCDRHHVQMSEAKIIRLERMRGRETWNKFDKIREIFTMIGGETP